MTRARAFAFLGVIAGVIAILPVLTALAGVGIARMAGCRVTAAGAQSCVVFGHEAKELIYSLSMSYWLLMFTVFYIPVAIGFFLVAFSMRDKRPDPDATLTRTGLVFWLTSIGLLILPLFPDFGLLLLAMAVLAYAVMRWRERRAATPSPPVDRDS